MRKFYFLFSYYLKIDGFFSPLDIQNPWETIFSSLQKEKQQKILQILDFFSLKNTTSIDIMKRERKKCTSIAFLGLSGN
jgi:hypothetical protein